MTEIHDCVFNKKIKKNKINHIYVPIITRAGTAFHSSQKVMNEDVTRIIPGIKTVVK